MKKVFFILSLLFVTCLSIPLFAQDDVDDGDDNGNEKIRDKMTEYIQKRLDLSKGETEKFAPIFIRYFREWRQTLRDSRGLPVLDRKQKMIDLRVRYRNQFKDIIGDKRSNRVFDCQDDFIREVIRLRNEQRLRNGPNRPLKRQQGVNKLL
jgi:hypothetical protein